LAGLTVSTSEVHGIHTDFQEICLRRDFRNVISLSTVFQINSHL